MTPKGSETGYAEDEKALVNYLKEALKKRGVLRFPRDWHLRQLATARVMLAGRNAPSLDEWRKCIDWAFTEPYWKNRIDHLARIEGLWPRYVLQARPGTGGDSRDRKKEREMIKKLYLS
ncbi:MAG: hypothetical protein AB1402_03115 [Bacillota bacterium]